ncbi:MAG: adenosylcobinamide-GDP ribazoletransferase [Pseudomonadota bacterium]
MRHEWAAFLLAVQFLTRVPILVDGIYTSERMAASVRYYPVVGLLVGAASALIFVLAQTLFPHTIAILLAIAAGLLLTGGFHEDGLADTFDGIGGGQTPERALEIMKDSRLGTYGTLALVAALALKVATLAALPAALVIAALVAGHGLSRLSAVMVIATSDYVRDEGTGKPVARDLPILSLVFVLATGIAIGIGWCLFRAPDPFACGMLGLFIGHVLMRLLFERKLGGYTGDTLGAVQQISEIGFYLGVLACL